MGKDNVVDRLVDEVDRVLAMNLVPEQREVLADALVTRLDLGTRILPPRLREVAAGLNRLLDELELIDKYPRMRGRRRCTGARFHRNVVCIASASDASPEGVGLAVAAELTR